MMDGLRGEMAKSDGDAGAAKQEQMGVVVGLAFEGDLEGVRGALEDRTTPYVTQPGSRPSEKVPTLSPTHTHTHSPLYSSLSISSRSVKAFASSMTTPHVTQRGA